ncbi:COX15/CtaA family protein [Stappia sp. ES.058]|uniref:COX15/CtaA family protein n=1 Tax=Stappia sp. ES.058 TaxID=1881061 RepID=UPI00087C2714|nr:COX15/CtaA family protein [Stappia sp. ES.058]SDU06757.1 cytochrome c oxidase assembly protein subunit 15 [Stappia sp. ES.058]
MSDVSFDTSLHAGPSSEKIARDRRAIRIWLYAVCLLILAMIVVGGATRLTDSGLSITEWEPIHGVIPPLSVAEWEEELEKYRQIPEYQLVNKGMSLGEFQFIYWWEWGHRLLGRVIGLAFFVPLVWLWARGRVESGLIPWLIGGFALGGMQGVIGWWMVASGLVDRVDVSQYRLATHLTLACLIFAYLFGLARYLALIPATVPRRPAFRGPYTGAAAALIALLFVQVFLGGLVAGLKAGLSFNTWPLMDGAFIPSGLWTMAPVWLNHFESALTVQFQHRMTAYALAIAAVWLWVSVMRNPAARHLSAVALALVLVIFIQMAIGIATLLGQVPFWLALAHQGFIVAVIAACIEFWTRTRFAARAA